MSPLPIFSPCSDYNKIKKNASKLFAITLGGRVMHITLSHTVNRESGVSPRS